MYVAVKGGEKQLKMPIIGFQKLGGVMLMFPTSKLIKLKNS